MSDEPTKEPPINCGRPLPPESGRWKKGVSGNPGGRPKKADTLKSLLKEELDKRCPADPEGRTWNELLVRAILQHALKGDSTAMKELLHIEGKDPQQSDLLGLDRLVERLQKARARIRD